MRFPVLLLTILISSAPFSARAGATTQADASAIERVLTHYLPAKAAGLIRIQPEADHYAMTIDPTNLITAIDDRVHPTSVTPLEFTLSNGADGLWTVKGNSSLKIAADVIAASGEKATIALEADSVDTQLTFDPAIGYPRDAFITLNGLGFSMISGTNTVSLKLGELQLLTSLKNIHSGTADLSASIAVDKITFGSNTGNVEITADGGMIETGFTDAKVAGIEKIIAFILDGYRRSPTVMTANDEKALRDMTLAELPLASGFSQSALVNELKVRAAGNLGALDGFKFSFEAPKEGDGTKIGFALVNPSLPPAILAPATAGLLPEKLNVETTIKGFHWAEAMDYAFRNVSMASDATPEQKQQFRKILAPDDRLVYSFENTWAGSSLYNVALGGWISTPVDPTKHAPELKMQIAATEVDTVSKYLFDRRETTTWFKVAVGILQAAKKMAKVEKDQLNWVVAFTPAQGLIINGIDLSH